MDPLPKYVDSWIVNRTGERHYLCRLCGHIDEDHGNESEFQRHLSSWPHKIRIKKMEALRCKTCDIQFKYQSHYNSHIESKSHKLKVDPSLKPSLSCDHCNFTFRTRAEYYRHINSDRHKKITNPPAESPTFCKICNKDYTFLSNMKAHLETAKHAKNVAKTNIAKAEPVFVMNDSNTKIDVVKPFLKWVGGKTQILNDVISMFPVSMKNYHEPFLGGGSVLLGFLSYVKHGKINITGKIYASDLNSNLIGLYRNIQSRPDELIQEGKKLVEEFRQTNGTHVNRQPHSLAEAMTSPESYYFWIRSRFNALSKHERMGVAASAMFLFMNKTCFRGVYREGPKGFNVPFGNYKNPTILEEEHIRTVSELIRDVIFTDSSFVDSFAKVTAGDFVYIDPPYAPETNTSFVSYTADGFNIDNHKALFKLCDDITGKGAMILMSNANVSLVRDTFSSTRYTKRVISCRRAIHSKKPETKTDEVLITNK
jgi:DNA adenine methylase